MSIYQRLLSLAISSAHVTFGLNSFKEVIYRGLYRGVYRGVLGVWSTAHVRWWLGSSPLKEVAQHPLNLEGASGKDPKAQTLNPKS